MLGSATLTIDTSSCTRKRPAHMTRRTSRRPPIARTLGASRFGVPRSWAGPRRAAAKCSRGPPPGGGVGGGRAGRGGGGGRRRGGGRGGGGPGGAVGCGGLGSERRRGQVAVRQAAGVRPPSCC